MDRLNDPAADSQFDALLGIPAVKALLGLRMTTHGMTSVRAFCADVLRYTNADTVTQLTCPAFVTDNETDEVSTGQGKILFDHLTCPKEFRLFTKAEGAEGHCEGMAPVVFWDAAFNWLDSLLPNRPEGAYRHRHCASPSPNHCRPRCAGTGTDDRQTPEQDNAGQLSGGSRSAESTR